MNNFNEYINVLFQVNVVIGGTMVYYLDYLKRIIICYYLTKPRLEPGITFSWGNLEG